MLYDVTLAESSTVDASRARGWRSLADERATPLHREWFGQLTICGAIIAAGFTALLAGLGVWFEVKVLLVGAAFVGAVFLVTVIALALARAGRLLLGAQLLAAAGVAHAIVQSYLFPFAASVLAVSAVLSVASVLPYVQGRPLRWLVVWSILSSLAIAALPSLSPLGAVVPPAAQHVIVVTALPAVTILTSLLLLQFSERIRHAREAEAAAHFETDQTRRALETTRQRLWLALSAVGIGIWDLDPTTGTLNLDRRCAIDSRPSGGCGALDYAGFLRLVVADDQERVDAASISLSRRRPREARSRNSGFSRRAAGRSAGFDSRPQLLVEGNRPSVDRDSPGCHGREESEAELRSAKEQAEGANRAKDEFLAMLGHELRNPLAPMLTALELLRVRMGEAGARERDVIHRQVRNLAQLVDDSWTSRISVRDG